MEPTTTPPISPLGQALGRLPSGLFIFTSRHHDRAGGLLASWVQQAGFDPPMLTVALRHDRPLTAWVAESGAFALSQLADGQKHLIRHFARGFRPDDDPFAGLAVRDDARGGPVLAEALAFLDLEVAGALDGGDHRIVLARVVGGAVFAPDAEPMVHVRRNGFHY
ncbi:MAG TPA: flavin reductase family protein [Isosphaeraceae bacterium]|jgi:flavin reductase (DIM6/NTAB) family NADH-FMN oxidoreductase RutF|nr:flavin reductase family protein [Isosphaeraceae bacterium]